MIDGAHFGDVFFFFVTGYCCETLCRVSNQQAVEQVQRDPFSCLYWLRMIVMVGRNFCYIFVHFCLCSFLAILGSVTFVVISVTGRIPCDRNQRPLFSVDFF